MWLREIKNSIFFLIIFGIMLGIIYPLFVASIGHLFFPWQTSGSLVRQNNQIIGSELMGQNFTDEKYFHGRPSANNYDALKSGGTNSSVEDAKYWQRVQTRITSQQQENHTLQKVPVDLVESSGSGLDPEISVQAAEYQANRIAQARQMPLVQVQQLIAKQIIKPELSIFGEPRVNVLELNLALDTPPYG